MSQGPLPFHYEADKSDSTATALAGLPIFLDMAVAAGLPDSIRRHVRAREGTRGWTDVQMIFSLLLLNITGGSCVEDLRCLGGDEGFRRLLVRAENTFLSRLERKAQESTLRKAGERAVPSPSAVFRYLAKFHDPSQEELRGTTDVKAFIPAPNEHLQGLARVNADLLAFVQSRSPQSVATLDQDATLVATTKEDALYCYKKFKAYQPFNTFWAEHGMVLHTEFRDGNVPAGHDQLRVLFEALDLLPEGVERVRLRSDTAGYQHELLRACAEGKHPRFGVIDFAVSADVTDEFKRAVQDVDEGEWKRLTKLESGYRSPTGQEFAEIPFFPQGSGFNKHRAPYRYIAIREVLEQRGLPSLDEEYQRRLPFQTIKLGHVHYKLFGLVTNLDWDGEPLIHWSRQRCGKSEEAHSVMKGDLAGGKLPSSAFGENAAWWWMMMLSMNLVTAVKRLALGGSWVNRRMKALRFALINVPGRVLEHARRLVVRIAQSHPALGLLLGAREAILELIDPIPQPSG